VTDRYQKEIEDLLRRMESRPYREPFSRRLARRTTRVRAGFQSGLRGYLRRPPVEQFMIASIALVLASLILRLVPPLQGLAYWTSILSLLFFVLAIGISIVSHRRPGASGERSWRGQVIDYRPRNPDLWWRLRQWFKRKR